MWLLGFFNINCVNLTRKCRSEYAPTKNMYPNLNYIIISVHFLKEFHQFFITSMSCLKLYITAPVTTVGDLQEIKTCIRVTHSTMQHKFHEYDVRIQTCFCLPNKGASNFRILPIKEAPGLADCLYSHHASNSNFTTTFQNYYLLLPLFKCKSFY